MYQGYIFKLCWKWDVNEILDFKNISGFTFKRSQTIFLRVIADLFWAEPLLTHKAHFLSK